jgi:hypothetical protein
MKNLIGHHHIDYQPPSRICRGVCAALMLTAISIHRWNITLAPPNSLSGAFAKYGKI